MSVNVSLPKPPDRYDPQSEAQRNQLIEQAFKRTGAGATAGGAGMSGIFDGGTATSTYVGAAVIDAGSST